MKIKVFGDLHGRVDWQKEVKDINNFDKIIFLGDYVDSFDISDKQIVGNLKDLIEFKKDNKNKVELILCNHDNMYLFLHEKKWQCSGYRESYAFIINKLLIDNKFLFSPAYQIDNWLFTHAGLNKMFLKKLQKKIPKKILPIQQNNYAQYLNTIFQSAPYYLNDVSLYRGGMEKYSGIFWQDINEYSKESHIDGLNQVVGHQPVKKITEIKYGKDSIIWIDTESHPQSVEKAILIKEI